MILSSFVGSILEAFTTPQIRGRIIVMWLSYSRQRFVMAFPSQKQEAFFSGHVRAFEHFGGVPWRISYDNLSTAVRLMAEGKVRREQRQFVAFRSYYLFESHFCQPEAGWEKGGVEAAVLCRHCCNSLYFTLLLPVHQGTHVNQLKAAQ